MEECDDVYAVVVYCFSSFREGERGKQKKIRIRGVAAVFFSFFFVRGKSSHIATSLTWCKVAQCRPREEGLGTWVVSTNETSSKDTSFFF